jgi:hypothetical protein
MSRTGSWRRRYVSSFSLMSMTITRIGKPSAVATRTFTNSRRT